MLIFYCNCGLRIILQDYTPRLIIVTSAYSMYCGAAAGDFITFTILHRPLNFGHFLIVHSGRVNAVESWLS
jgi:hypothetical protein